MLKNLFLIILFTNCSSPPVITRTPASTNGSQCIDYIERYAEHGQNQAFDHFYYTQDSLDKFNSAQLKEIQNVFERIQHRIKINTQLEVKKQIQVSIKKRWKSISAFYPDSPISKVDIPFCYNIKDIIKETPDESAVFVIAHEYGHIVFDTNIKIKNSKRWDFYIYQKEIYRKMKTAETENNYLTQEILQTEYSNKLRDLELYDYYRQGSEDKILGPYDELFADVVGLSEFGANDVVKIKHKRVPEGFSQDVPVAGWNDIEEHRYFDPVRSWLWKRVLSLPQEQELRDKNTEKIFKVIQQQLQDIFDDKKLFSLALDRNGSIEFMNTRLIKALEKTDF